MVFREGVTVRVSRVLNKLSPLPLIERKIRSVKERSVLALD